MIWKFENLELFNIQNFVGIILERLRGAL